MSSLEDVDFWLREVDFWLREDELLAVAREDLPRALVASRGLSLRLPLAFLRAAPEGFRVGALEPGEAVSAWRVVPEVLREARLCAAVRSVLLICVPPSRNRGDSLLLLTPKRNARVRPWGVSRRPLLGATSQKGTNNPLTL